MDDELLANLQLHLAELLAEYHCLKPLSRQATIPYEGERTASSDIFSHIQIFWSSPTHSISISFGSEI